MIDIIENERRVRDDMIARGEVPAPDEETLRAMVAAGIGGLHEMMSIGAGYPEACEAFGDVCGAHGIDPGEHK